jgi:hypothetical protein
MRLIEFSFRVACASMDVPRDLAKRKPFRGLARPASDIRDTGVEQGAGFYGRRTRGWTNVAGSA